MKEEEIIKIIKEKILLDFNCYNPIDKIELQAIQGLLDLYEKEKEKNIYLTQELETRKWVKVKENGEVEPAFYISKDKIREKIKWLDRQCIHKYYENVKLAYDILESLLEEE